MKKTIRKPIKENQVSEAIITNRGKIFLKSEMTKYEVGKAFSQQETPAKFGEDIIKPPYDLDKLMAWMHVSVVHSSCIHVKKQDSVGTGYEFFSEDETQMIDYAHDENYNRLTEFFQKVNDEEDIVSVLKKVAIDFDGCGNGYIEVSRDAASDHINGLYHSNGTKMRVHKDKRRFIQKVNNKNIWFKKFGEKDELNKYTGEWGKINNPQEAANEIIHIKQYSWISSYYGVPEWLPALYPMFGNLKEREYNTDFFINFGIPAYAILVQGTTLNQTVKDSIKKFFEVELKGSAHKTLTMSTPKGAEIKFQALNVDIKEASFRMFRKDNRDEILTAHHVPPYRVGIVEQGQLGGNVAEETDAIYLDSVINPRQQDIEWIINELLIKQGMEIQGWNFKFQDIKIDDVKRKAEIHEKYFGIAVMSPNEIRSELGLDPYIGGDVYYVKSNMIPIGTTEEHADGATEEIDTNPTGDDEEEEEDQETANGGRSPEGDEEASSGQNQSGKENQAAE